MSPPRWNHNTTCKFVECYIQHECLWNMNIALYQNKQARESALKRIVEDMPIDGFGVEQVKQKIKSLRATYQQEHAKVANSEKSGAGAEDVYTPTMKWLNAMHDVMRSGQLKRNSASNLNNRTTVDDNKIGNNHEDIANEGNIQLVELNQPVATIPAPDSQQNSASLRCIPTPQKKRSRSKITEVKAAVQELKYLNQFVNREEKEDARDIFGRHVVMQLKELSVEQCILAQDEVQRVVTRHRLNDFRKKSVPSSIKSYQTDCSHLYTDISDNSATQEYTVKTPIPSPLSNDSFNKQQYFTYQKSGVINDMSDSQLPNRYEGSDIISAAIAQCQMTSHKK